MLAEIRKPLIMNSFDLKKIRKENGLSQESFADRLKVNIRTVQNWEQGAKITPSMEKLISYEFLANPQSSSNYENIDTTESNEVADVESIYKNQSGLRMLSIFEDYIPDELADMYKKLQDELVDLYEYKELYYKAKEAYRPK